MDMYEVVLTLTEPMLGTVPKSQEVYADYVASKAALTDEAIAEELETVSAIEEKGWTGFHMENGQPVVYDYVVKGFLKNACYFMRQVEGSLSAKFPAYKRKIDGLVFIYPRRIPLLLDGASMGVVERPLRADTAQGPRVALARSDSCPAGTTLAFTVEVIGGVSKPLLREWLDYGQRMGLGQWRSGGYGRFRYTIEQLG